MAHYLLGTPLSCSLLNLVTCLLRECYQRNKEGGGGDFRFWKNVCLGLFEQGFNLISLGVEEGRCVCVRGRRWVEELHR